MKLPAWSSDSCVPVSSQATPPAEFFDVQAPALEIGQVDIGNFEFAPGRRAKLGGNVHHPIVIKVQAGHRVRGAGPGGFFRPG